VDGNTSIRNESSTATSETKDGSKAFAQLLVSSKSREVVAQRTPISPEAARDAIARAYEELTGQPLDVKGQAILTAQWAHETAHGASMFNFNFGGLKGAGPGGLSVSQRTTEGYGTTSRRIVDQFRAYGSVDEGAKDYVRLLLNRYGDAVSAAERGDAVGFVQGLKQRGYFTGDPIAYERNIKSIAQGFGQSFANINETSPRPFANEKLGSDGVMSPRLNENPKMSLASITDEPSLHVRSLLSRMQDDFGWLAAPEPTALLGTESSDESESSPLGKDIGTLSVLHALSMTDEVTRSALQIAQEDSEKRRRGPVDKSS
jgi:flagellum-specific peptidoglycan hydrolase FlgJ